MTALSIKIYLFLSSLCILMDVYIYIYSFIHTEECGYIYIYIQFCMLYRFCLFGRIKSREKKCDYVFCQKKVYTGNKLSIKLLCIDGLMLNANFINTVFSPLFLFFIFARKFSQYLKLFHPYFLFFLKEEKIKKVSLPFRKHFVDQQQNIFIHSFIHSFKERIIRLWIQIILARGLLSLTVKI